jgi:HK97 gp10 family phage protein
MAKVDFNMPDDFLLKVSLLADKTDEILPKVLESGAEVVLAKVKSNISSVVGKNTKEDSRSTGELESALGVSPALQDRNGDFNVKIGFAEPRSDGKSNAMIANILEYGKHGQPPKPFLKPAKTQTKNACIEAMKNKLESEMNSL